MEKKRIICISHAFIKKINLSVFERLSEDESFHVTCIGPEFININKKKYYPDYDIESINIDLRLLKLKFENLRFIYFNNIKKNNERN